MGSHRGRDDRQMITPKQLLYDIVKNTLGDVQPIAKEEILKAANALFCERNDWGSKALMIFCDTYAKRYHNMNYDPASNGEYWILQQIATASPQVIFDVGANEGNWSLVASKLFRTATIHAFELVPTTFEKFSALTAGRERIVGHNVGLADEAKAVEVNVYAASTGYSSLFAYPQHGLATKVSAQTRRADTYIAEKNITHIDFLKIDTEGAEPLVLKGFGSYLSDDFIDVIQFEYGTMNSRTQFFLQDFYHLFHAKNFSLGKLYPHGVEFTPYDTTDAAMYDAYFGPNYIAVSNKRPDLIERLKAK
ncbi:MAG: hypothetical protein B9S32_14340 [Verrucomicrobia bacterium Tous-C9LFEB]|nr:MAG: hypothetical protein B9S32_14340 [Verrucomicrobia bacterium Tous-C9LFEB]